MSTDYFASVFDKVAPKLSSMWQSSADKHGWPANVAKSVGVGVDHQGMSVSYPSEMQGTVEDLEYGHLRSKTPPAPAMREYVENAEGEIKSNFGDRALEVITSKILSQL